MIPKIQPCLWFDGNAEEAAQFYADTFPDTRIESIERAPGDYPAGKRGNVLIVTMTILGAPFFLLNAGPQFKFNEAVSFQVATDDQLERDHAERWTGKRLRLVQGPLRPVLADHAASPDVADVARRRSREARLRIDDDHAQDRHRRARPGSRGRRLSFEPAAANGGWPRGA